MHHHHHHYRKYNHRNHHYNHQNQHHRNHFRIYHIIFIFYLVTFCFSSIVQRLFMVSLARFKFFANSFHVASSTTSEWWWPSIALRMIVSSSSLKWPFFNSFVVTLTDGLMFSTNESSIVFFGWTSSRSPVNLPRLSSSSL